MQFRNQTPMPAQEPRTPRRCAITRRGLIAASLVAGASIPFARGPVFAQESGAAGAIEVPANAVAWLKYNLNSASSEQFMGIPGAGERMTREFEEYRPYTTIGQYHGEIGKYISPEEVAALEQYLYVPVDPGQADTDTLQQLPGVSAEIAQALEDGGPYDSADAFLSALAALISPELADAATSYVQADGA